MKQLSQNGMACNSIHFIIFHNFVGQEAKQNSTRKSLSAIQLTDGLDWKVQDDFLLLGILVVMAWRFFVCFLIN